MKDSQQIGLVPRLGQWWADGAPHGEFWVLVIATFLFNLGVSIFFFLYNLFMLDLGYREGSLGVLSSAMALGSMAGTIPMGLFARRFGLKRVLILCLLLMAAAFGARVFLFWYPAQIAFAFLDGVTLCGWVVCLLPAVAAVVDESKRPSAFSVLFAVAVATGSLGGLIGGHMPGWCQQLGAHFGGIALSSVDAKRITLLAACFLPALAAWPIRHLTTEAQSQSVRWAQRPSPFLLRFLLASALWAAALGAFNPFTNVFFVRYLGVQTAHLGNFFSVAQLLQAGAVLLMPIVLRRMGLVSGVMVAQLVTAAAICLLATGHDLLREEVIFCIFLGAQHMCEPGMQSLLMDCVAAEERSGATAMNYLVVSVSQAAGAAVAGIAFVRFGYPPVLAGISIVTVGAAAAFRILCASAENHRSINYLGGRADCDGGSVEKAAKIPGE